MKKELHKFHNNDSLKTNEIRKAFIWKSTSQLCSPIYGSLGIRLIQTRSHELNWPPLAFSIFINTNTKSPKLCWLHRSQKYHSSDYFEQWNAKFNSLDNLNLTSLTKTTHCFPNYTPNNNSNYRNKIWIWRSQQNAYSLPKHHLSKSNHWTIPIQHNWFTKVVTLEIPKTPHDIPNNWTLVLFLNFKSPKEAHGTTEFA